MILSENRFPLFGIMRRAFVQADDNVWVLLFIPCDASDHVPPADLKPGARSPAAAKAPLASTEVIATVVRRSVTPLPAAAKQHGGHLNLARRLGNGQKVVVAEGDVVADQTAAGLGHGAADRVGAVFRLDDHALDGLAGVAPLRDVDRHAVLFLT